MTAFHGGAKPYFRVKAAAEYLSLSESLLNKLRCKGKGPRFSRLGRAVVYSRADLDAWAAERAVGSTSEAA